MISASRVARIATAVMASMCFLTSASFQFSAGAQEHPAQQQASVQQSPQPSHPGGDEQQKDAKETPIPPEKSSVTHHELSMGGKSLKYTATAGTLLIRDEEDKPYGSMFYVAYTLDGAEPATRPVSFLYNGGPGAATLWLHMGSFSPVRDQNGQPKSDGGAAVQAGAEPVFAARQDGPGVY